jgi:hypothetical protein
MASPYYSKLPHKKNIFPPPRNLLEDVYGVCNDDIMMLRAGKLRVWKQWANCYRGMGV